MRWHSSSISSVPVQICEHTGPSRDEKRRAATTVSEASETFADTPISSGLVSTERRRTFSRTLVGTLFLGLQNLLLTVTARAVRTAQPNPLAATTCQSPATARIPTSSGCLCARSGKGIQPRVPRVSRARRIQARCDSPLVSSLLVTTSFARIVSQPSIRQQTISNELSLSTTPPSAFIIHGGRQAPHHRAGQCQFCQCNGRRRTLSLARAQNVFAASLRCLGPRQHVPDCAQLRLASVHQF